MNGYENTIHFLCCKNEIKDKKYKFIKALKNLYETDQNPRQNGFLKYVKDKELEFDEDWLTNKTI